MNIVQLVISLSTLAVAVYAVVASQVSDRRNRARQECRDLIERATAAGSPHGAAGDESVVRTGNDWYVATPRPALRCLPGGALLRRAHELGGAS